MIQEQMTGLRLDREQERQKFESLKTIRENLKNLLDDVFAYSSGSITPAGRVQVDGSGEPSYAIFFSPSNKVGEPGASAPEDQVDANPTSDVRVPILME